MSGKAIAHRACFSGFTLIELLVVIAVVAVLATIVIPVALSGTHSARQAKSISNLKGIGSAVNLYLVDNDNVFPAVGQGSGFTAPLWTNSGLHHPEWNGLGAYLGSKSIRSFTDFRGDPYRINEVYYDPTLPENRHSPMGDYAASREVFRPQGSELSANVINNAPEKLVIVITAEMITQSPPIGAWYMDTWNWVHGISVVNPPSNRGRGGVPALFMDGHVELLDKKRMNEDAKFRRSHFLINP